MGNPSIAASLSAATQVQDVKTDRGISGRALVPQPGRPTRAMRRYRIASLRSDGSVHESEQIGPATPAFESAFSAFAHGTLIQTTRGQVAIEDMVPGMKVTTADGAPLQVLWVGSMTIVPGAQGVAPRDCRLTRVMTDAFGLGRPEKDLMAGPGARILMRPQGLRDALGGDRVLTPARDLADGLNAIEITPQRPVTVYHLCLRRHAIITAAGLEVESFHPGAGFERSMGGNMLSLFLSLFPHIREPRDFGNTAYPRLPLSGA